ncbi:Aspartic proteinase A1 [Zea mays]
MLSET